LVYALKSYSNNQQNNRAGKRSALDSFVKKFASEPVAPYKTYQKEKKSFIDKSIQNLAVNSIIEGYFPKENVVRQMAIKRVNKLLCVLITMLIAVAVVSYYFVISCEMKLNDLGRQTVMLNNENTELQNKLDQLKSFSNVDKTFQQNKMLKRAGQVIETQAVTVEQAPPITHRTTKRKIFNHAIGF